MIVGVKSSIHLNDAIKFVQSGSALGGSEFSPWRVEQVISAANSPKQRNNHDEDSPL